MSKPIKVIDLFAGPGGLGEGFSAFRFNNEQRFRVALSAEKDASAHRTLTLRALYRQFDHMGVPESYYAFLRGELGRHPEDQLYNLPEIRKPLAAAMQEVQQLTLGEDSPQKVYRKIRTALAGEECVVIGGPPCQAYSLVGRSRNFGAKDKTYSAEDDHRNFLYKEYLKILAKFQPMVFVMENVKGILSAKVNGKHIFHSIRSDLQDPCGSIKVTPDKGRDRHRYHLYSFVRKRENFSLFSDDTSSASELDPRDFIIRCENYGVPQARHRVILLGIREDIDPGASQLQLLNAHATAPTVEQAISDLPRIRSKVSKTVDSFENWRHSIQSFDKKSLQALGQDDHVPNLVYHQFLEQLQNLDKSPQNNGQDKGLKRRAFNSGLSKQLKNWYEDSRLEKVVLNHESRGHIPGDLHRYLYYSTYADVVGGSPKSSNLPKVLWPAHKNFDSGKFADRFRVQLAGCAGTTVTSHISKDGHYFIHYDPTQCRSLTVREAARLQTFPDNYYFVGNRTQQYTQVGNAVPPFLAYQLAEVVSGLVD